MTSHRFGLRVSSMLLAACAVACFAPSGRVSAQQRAPGQLFERLDGNGDGVVDREELESARRSTFERADRNGDGYLTSEEAKSLADERDNVSGRRRMRDGTRASRGAFGERRDAGDVFARLDADGDGRVSEVEFIEAENPLLAAFDADRDGRITRAEMDKARQRMREDIRRLRRPSRAP